MSLYFTNNRGAYFVVKGDIPVNRTLLAGRSFNTINEMFDYVCWRDESCMAEIYGTEIIVFRQSGADFYAVNHTPKPMPENIQIEDWLNRMTVDEL